MLISTVNKIVTTLLSAPPQPAAQTPANASVTEGADNNNGGVKFDISDNALESVSKNAAQNPTVIAERVAEANAAAAPALEATVNAVVDAGAEASASVAATKTTSGRSYVTVPVAEEKPASAAPMQEAEVEFDPSEEARARAHAEQQLESSRLRNLAIAGYDDSRKLLDLNTTEAKAADTRSEAAPLRQALKAA